MVDRFLRREGRGPGDQKTSLAYIKVQPVMELLLLRNRNIFVYDMARQSSGVLLSPIQNIGGKITKRGQFT